MLSADIKRLTQELDMLYRTISATAANQQRIDRLDRVVNREVTEAMP
jgi:hypothetical protein